MPKNALTKKPTRAQLQHKIMELEGQLAHAYHFADVNLNKAGNLAGSGVLLQLSFLGGRTIINPVVIKDGLSPETIAAVRLDLQRSWKSATEFKPRGV